MEINNDEKPDINLCDEVELNDIQNKIPKNHNFRKKMILFISLSLIILIILIIIGIIIFISLKHKGESIDNYKCKEECLVCDNINNECIKCKSGYKLINGLCVSYYSFKAVYKTNKEYENIDLINNKSVDIIQMKINDTIIKPTMNYTFHSIGIYNVYFLLNMTNIYSISEMF